MYYVGQDIELTGLFTYLGKAPTVTLTGLACTVIAPDGSTSTPTPVSLGHGYVKVTITAAAQVGIYKAHFTATNSSGLDGDAWGQEQVGTAAPIAAALWQDTTAGDFTVAGSPGKSIMMNLDAAVSSRSTYAGGPVASVVAGVTLTSSALDAIVTETGINHRQAQALILDACCSILAGATGGAGTITIKNPANTATRISATVDANGNRTAVTLTPPA